MERRSIVRTRDGRPAQRRKPSTPLHGPSFAETVIFVGLAAVMLGAMALRPDYVRMAFDAVTSHWSTRAVQARTLVKTRLIAYESARGFIRERTEPSMSNHFSNLDQEPDTSCRQRRDGLWEAMGFVEWNSPRGRQHEPWVVLVDEKGKEQRYLRVGAMEIGQWVAEPASPTAFRESIQRSGFESAR